MEMKFLEVQPDGTLVIPAEFVKELDIQPGEVTAAFTYNSTILLKAVESGVTGLLSNSFYIDPVDFKQNSKEARSKKTKSAEKTIVLSISLGKGCYRHLRVDMNYTLEELSDAILSVFRFFNDHAHAFFMNNRTWTHDNCYYMEEVDEFDEYEHTCDIHLYELGLKKGDAFKYVFDFGDEWVFQCKVLRLEEEETDEFEVIRYKGDAPEQYPDFDDFDDDF